MTRLLQILTLAGFSCFTSAAVSAQTQQKSQDKLGEFDEIIIKHKSDKDGKVTVEIKDGDVLVNGEKLDQYNDPDISVFRRKITPRDGNVFSFNNGPNGNFDLFNGDDMPMPANKAILGVITEKQAAAGVTVKSVAKGTPAEKAGIREGDIITAIDNEKINEPAGLFEAIGQHKPGDKVTVTYIRDSKTNKATVTLDERKEMNPGGWVHPPLSQMPQNAPHIFSFPPRGRQDFDNNWFARPRGDNARLGLQVEDTENDEGARVIDIEPDSQAQKAGFLKNDIITGLAGKTIKSAADLAATYRENRESNVTATVKRNGKKIEIKVPKKLNKAAL
jgi:hypothetical protein